MGFQPYWCHAVEFVGDYNSEGPIVLGPEATRRVWEKARTPKTGLRAKRLAVIGDFLVLPGARETRMYKIPRGAVLVRWLESEERYDEDDMGEALTITIPAITGWQPTKLVWKLAGKPALFDARVEKNPDYSDMNFVDFHSPKLAAGRYAIDVVPRYTTSLGVFELIRLRPPGPLPPEKHGVRAPELAARPTATSIPLTKEIAAAAKKMAFAGTLGGPPVLAPAEALATWRGKDHYDLACDAGVGVFDFEGHTLLATRADAAEVHVLPDGALIMYRDVGDAASCLAAALTVPEKAWKKTRDRFTTGKSGKLAVFDPIENGKSKKAKIALRPGTYRVDVLPKPFKAQVDGEPVEVTLVRLVRV